MPDTRLKVRGFETTSSAPPASRASWVGVLQFNDFSLPVKAYSAIASLDSHLHLIHVNCGRRLSLQKACPEHGPLSPNEIQKAYEYSSDCLIELSDDELAQLSPTDDKKIVVERFFSPLEFDFSLLAGRTLFLLPASQVAVHAFQVLKAALDQQNVWALGRTVFSQKRTLLVINSRDDAMFLHTLHDPALRRQTLPLPSNGPAPTRSEIRRLTSVMGASNDPIRWTDYPDTFQEQLATLVARKITSPRSGRKAQANSNKVAKFPRQTRVRRPAKAA